MRKGKLFLLILGAAAMLAFAPVAAPAQQMAAAKHHAADSLAKRAPAARPAAEATAEPAPAAEEGKAGENEGLPQLDAATYPSQLFWLFASFVVLYALMSKVALPRVAAVLDQREALRDGNLKSAQGLQEEASKIKTVYEAALAKAQAEAQSALSASEQEISEKIAAENAKFAEAARKRVATAEQAIAKAKKDAVASLADISADIASEMVNKVAGIQVGKPEAKKAVTTVMQKEAA